MIIISKDVRSLLDTDFEDEYPKSQVVITYPNDYILPEEDTYVATFLAFIRFKEPIWYKFFVEYFSSE
jgi:hypothetical protein